MNPVYEFKAAIERYPVENGWHLVRVPKKLSKPLEIMADRGLIAVTTTVGSSSWDNSLLPYGDGSHFIPLPAKVRKKEGIDIGNTIKVSFTPRDR